MASEQLGYADYLKAAFRRRIQVPVLGSMPLNQMGLVAFALLGLANPGFWFLGTALEVAFLVLRSTSKRFQNLVEGERLLRRQVSFEETVKGTLASLPEPARERYRRLLRECGAILGITQTVDQERLGTLQDLRAGGLNQLLWLFLRLLTSREKILANLSQVDRSSVEAAVEHTRKRLAQAEPDSALARSLQGTLEIQLKRLENLTRANKSLEVIDAELDRIEQQVRLIREEAAVSGDPEFLSARLDAVSSTLAETSRWVDQHAEFLGSLDLDDQMGGPTLLHLPDEPLPTPPPPPVPKTRQKA